jgi:hypothetical protein
VLSAKAAQGLRSPYTIHSAEVIKRFWSKSTNFGPNIQHCLSVPSLVPAEDPTHELATLRAASRTAPSSNSGRPGSTSRQQQQQPATGGAAAGNSSNGGAAAAAAAGAGGTYAALELELAALQTALGVKISSSHPTGSREHVVDVLGQLCQQLGLPVTADIAASPKACAATVTQLKENIGI